MTYPQPSVADQGRSLSVSPSGPTAQWTRRKSISVAEFGAQGNGSGGTDDAPAISAAINWCKNNGVKELELTGNHRLCSRLPTIDFPLMISGTGKTSSVLHRDYNEPHPQNGVLTFWAGSAGFVARDFGVSANLGTTGGSAILVACPSVVSNSPDFGLLDNLYLTTSGNNTWGQYTLYIDGINRPGTPIGIRDLCIRDCSVFGAPHGSVGIMGSVAMTWNGGGVFQAGGASGKIVISGTSSTNTHTINLNMSQIPGLDVSYTTNGVVNASIIGAVNKGTSVTSFRVNGSLI